jgi:hypothetical protein
LRDYALLCQALPLAVAGRLGLLLFSLAGVRRSMRWLLRSEHPLPPHRRCSAQQVIRAAVSASIHSPVGSTCLSTALLAQAMLKRHGYDPGLRLGVRRDAHGAFAAHAWLEWEGQVIVGGPAAEIATYARLPEMEHLIR